MRCIRWSPEAEISDEQKIRLPELIHRVDLLKDAWRIVDGGCSVGFLDIESLRLPHESPRVFLSFDHELWRVAGLHHCSQRGSRRPGPISAAASASRCACTAVGFAPPVSATLGTFQPTPYLTVRSNWPAGGGYSPLEYYGDVSLSLYGPLSSYRAVAAPVVSYTRGYDGRVYATQATSFSTPNQPDMTLVVYPTPANYFYAPRGTRTPPQWTSGINWIDQN